MTDICHSAFVSFVTILAMMVVPGWIAKQIQVVQTERLKKADARIQLVSETMNVIRMIKLFGWERKMKDKISQQRREELKYLLRRRIVEKSSKIVVYCIPIAVMLATYAT